MSTVQLRRPRRILASGGRASALPTGRPKSWGEFNTNFKAIRESTSNNDLTDIKENNLVPPVTSSQRTQSSSYLLNEPTFRSVQAPTWNRSKSTSDSAPIDTVFSQDQPEADKIVPKHTNGQERIIEIGKENHGESDLPRAIDDVIRYPAKTGSERPSILKSGHISDDSCDSAIAVSVTSNSQLQDTTPSFSSTWSPVSDTRQQRHSYDLESVSTTSNCDVTDAEKLVVPSPLKDCYGHLHDMSPASISSASSSEEDNGAYDADRSTNEEFQQKAKSLRARKQQNTQNKSPHSDDEVAPKNVACSTGTWPRRKREKFEQSPEELMRQFRELASDHLTKLRGIYSESRRKVDDLLLSLKLTMTKNGYNKPAKIRS